VGLLSEAEARLLSEAEADLKEVLRSVEAVAGETRSDETMTEVRRLVTEVSPAE
jgi:hypothetical protein